MRTVILGTFILALLCSPVAQAAQLSTGYGVPGGSSQSTTMFDIEVGGQDLVLTQVGANMQADPGAAVYVRVGSYVGNEFSAAGWVEIYNNAGMVANGNGVETILDVNDYVLSASTTYGIAIVAPDRQELAPGSVPGAIAASNADLSIKEGSYTNSWYPNGFAGNISNSPHVVETTLYYDIAAQAVPTASTGALALLGVSIIGVALLARRRVRG